MKIEIKENLPSTVTFLSRSRIMPGLSTGYSPYLAYADPISSTPFS